MPVSAVADHRLGKMLDKRKNKGDFNPYLRNVNVRWFGFDLSDLKEMRFTNDEFNKYAIEKGDLVICEGGYPGRAAIWESDETILFQKALHRVRFHEPERNEWFLYYLFYSDSSGLLSSHFTGSGIQHFTGQTLAKLVVPLPPLPEQKRIVAILDEAFGAIEKAKENAARNLANAKELFDSYLDRVFTQQGEGWEEKTLSEVALTFGRGKSRHRPRNDKSLCGGVYPFVQTGEIRNAKHFLTDYTQTYNEKGLAQSKLWPKGTLCITIAANIAETAILTFQACIPDSVIGLVCNPSYAEVDFVEYALQYFKARLQAEGKGSAQDNINMGTFERMQFPFPQLSEQVTIVRKLNALAGSCENLGQKFGDRASFWVLD